MQTDIHEIPQTILDQLLASKVNGFPFFKYTGIKEYNLEGNDTLFLKEIPTNPKKVTGIQIVHSYGSDTYRMAFFQKDQRAIPMAKFDDVYFDQMSEIIVNTMGIN